MVESSIISFGGMITASASSHQPLSFHHPLLFQPTCDRLYTEGCVLTMCMMLNATLHPGDGIGEPGGNLYAPFNAFTGGQAPWVKLPHVHDRLVIGDRYAECHAELPLQLQQALLPAFKASDQAR
jgi:hypothetical protein